MAPIQEVAAGVHRCADGIVNWYLVEDGRDVTLVDAGWPRSWPRVQAALAALGRTPADLRAIVLTHGHVDHLGTAERARVEAGATVYAHRDEVARTQGRAAGTSALAVVPGLLPNLWRPTVVRFMAQGTARGSLRPAWLGAVTAFDDGEALDVPGRPRVVATPGHTEGHAALHLPDRGVVLTGDALVTRDVLTGATGPRLMPDALSADPARAREAARRLAGLDAGTLLPGHGDPYVGAPADAVARALERG